MIRASLSSLTSTRSTSHWIQTWANYSELTLDRQSGTSLDDLVVTSPLRSLTSASKSSKRAHLSSQERAAKTRIKTCTFSYTRFLESTKNCLASIMRCRSSSTSNLTKESWCISCSQQITTRRSKLLSFAEMLACTESRPICTLKQARQPKL